MGVARVIYYNRKLLDDTIWMHTQIKANNNNNNNSIIYPRKYYCYSTNASGTKQMSETNNSNWT